MTLLRIRGEYWVTKTGDVIAVEAEGGHEQEVLSVICHQVLDVLGLEVDEPDIQSADGAIKAFLRANGLTREQLPRSLVPKARVLAELAPFIAFQSDARVYAQRQWGWIRVAGSNVEAESIDAAAARVLREALLTLLIEQEGAEDEAEALQVRLDVYVARRGTFQMSVSEIGEPDTWAGNKHDPQLESAGAIAAEQIRRQQLRAQNPCYTTLGD